MEEADLGKVLSGFLGSDLGKLCGISGNGEVDEIGIKTFEVLYFPLLSAVPYDSIVPWPKKFLVQIGKLLENVYMKCLKSVRKSLQIVGRPLQIFRKCLKPGEKMSGNCWNILNWWKVDTNCWEIFAMFFGYRAFGTVPKCLQVAGKWFRIFRKHTL